MLPNLCTTVWCVDISVGSVMCFGCYSSSCLKVLQYQPFRWITVYRVLWLTVLTLSCDPVFQEAVLITLSALRPKLLQAVWHHGNQGTVTALYHIAQVLADTTVTDHPWTHTSRERRLAELTAGISHNPPVSPSLASVTPTCCHSVWDLHLSHKLTGYRLVPVWQSIVWRTSRCYISCQRGWHCHTQLLHVLLWAAVCWYGVCLDSGCLPRIHVPQCTASQSTHCGII